MNPFSRMAMADKLSIPQLKLAIRNGTVPSYIGIPLLQDKVNQAKEAQSMDAAAQAQVAKPPIAQQVMNEASGVEQLHSGLPTETMADGGIVAFSNGGLRDDKTEDDELEELFPVENAIDEDAFIRAIVASGGKQAPESKGIKTERGEAPSPKGSTMFEKALNFIFPHEGGYVNHPSDRGGPTNMGVTQRTLSAYLGRPASIDDVKNLDRATARDIYKTMYWDKIGGDNLDPKTAMLAFDTAVGSGVGKAKQMLAKYGDNPDAFLSAKKQWLKDIVASDPSQKVFDPGWQRRMNNLGAYAQQLSHGGIANLASGGEVKHYDGEDESLVTADNNDYMRRVEAVQNLPGAMKKGIIGLTRAINPLERGYDALDSIRNYMNQPKDEQRLEWQIAKDIREGKRGIFDTEDDIKADKEKLKQVKDERTNKTPNTTPATVSPEENERELRRLRNAPVGINRDRPPTAAPVTTPSGNVATEDDIPTGQTKADYFGAAPAAEKDEYVKNLRDRIFTQMEEAKAEKDQNKYLALLQAGLSMMGGTSPYAAANIGAGGAQGVNAYAGLEGARRKDLRDLQSQELALYKYEQAAKNAAETRRLNDMYRRAVLGETQSYHGAELDYKNRALAQQEYLKNSASLDNIEKNTRQAVINAMRIPNIQDMDADTLAKVDAETRRLLGQNKRYTRLYSLVNEGEPYTGTSGVSLSPDVQSLVDKYKK